jgi:hypothetical protein
MDKCKLGKHASYIVQDWCLITLLLNVQYALFGPRVSVASSKTPRRLSHELGYHPTPKRENTEEEQKPIEDAEWEQRTEYIRLMGEEPMKTKWAKEAPYLRIPSNISVHYPEGLFPYNVLHQFVRWLKHVGSKYYLYRFSATPSLAAGNDGAAIRSVRMV